MRADHPIKRTFEDMLRVTAIGPTIQKMVRRSGCGILVYHDPKPDTLDAHLSHLKRSNVFVSLDDLLAATSGDAPLPNRGLVLCFDDGHAGNWNLINVLRRHKVRPTIFVCSAIVGTGRMFWWQYPSVGSHVERMKRLPNRQRVSLLAQAGFDQTAEWPERRALSFSELHDLLDVADIQAHTRFHPILTRCSDEECETELVRARVEIEQLTGKKCEHFAYPNGNYDQRVVGLVRRAGYKCARALDIGWNHVGTDPFRLRSITIPDNASIAWLDAQLTGLPTYLRYLRGGCVSGLMPQF